MRLRTKLFLVTASATLIPIVGATLGGRELVRRDSKSRFDRALSEGEKEVKAQFAQFARQLRRAVERLADAEDSFVGPLLIALAKGGPDDEMFRRLPRQAQRVMRERGLDVLTVIGPKQRILGCGHFPGRAGERVARKTLPSRGVVSGVPRLLTERVMAGGRPKTRVVLAVYWKAKSTLGTSVWVIGGRFVDQSFVRRLRFGGDIKVRLKARGQVLAQPKQGFARYAHYAQRKFSIPVGKSQLGVALALSDQRLRLTLEILNLLAVALGFGALLLALLMGGLARLFTRPLQELVEGAEAVAAGDLDYRIERDSSDEVGDLVRSFNHMIAELRDSNERLVAAERVAAWREIARRIAHEIKNPLSPIQTSIETLRKAHRKKHPAFEEIFSESTTTILQEVERMKRIVSEFSDFARMPKPKLAQLELDGWLESTLSLFCADQIALSIDQQPGLVIDADGEQLRQVLLNLAKNAIDATRAKKAGRQDGARDGGDYQPRLDVSLKSDKEMAVIVLRDNGIGFDEGMSAKIFTPYFTTKGSSGTGLGLAICHRIVTDHGGTIEASSRAGEGTQFTLRLPLHHGAVTQDERDQG
jgi:two-component system nitrogen regulation sensor histidine kinase NtrY